MSDRNHTPVPYHIGGTDGISRSLYIENCTGNTVAIVPFFNTETEHQGNAEFIVRACNTHDALVTSCKLAMEGVEGMLGGWLGVQQPYAPEWAGALHETLKMLQSTLAHATLEEPQP